MNEILLTRRPARTSSVCAATAAILLAILTGCASDPVPRSISAPAATAAGDVRPSNPASWIAVVADGGAMDIALVRPGEPAHRIIGADDDGIARLCPAFAPDGTRLAFGEATGSFAKGWTDVAIVTADVNAEGAASVVKTIGLDGSTQLPCPIWSPDGRWIATGVMTDDDPGRVADEIWLIDPESAEIVRLAGLSATDLEWAPDGSELYIVDESGILVYSLADAQTRVLTDTEGARTLAVSPDGRRLAVEQRRINAAERFDLVLMDPDGSDRGVLVKDFTQTDGIGPMWSPDGDRIALARSCGTFTDLTGADRTCYWQNEVVVVTVAEGDPLGPVGTQSTIANPQIPSAGEPAIWFPSIATWSPDGTNLLYQAQAELEDWEASTYMSYGLLTVSIDGATPPVLLYEAIGEAGDVQPVPANDFQRWSAP